MNDVVMCCMCVSVVGDGCYVFGLMLCLMILVGNGLLWVCDGNVCGLLFVL